MFQKFRDAGLCVIPTHAGIPMVKWSAFQQELPSAEMAAEWDKNYIGANYELVCGAISGVVGLDFDTDDVAVISRISSIAGHSPVKKIGSKGFTLFYKYNGEATRNWDDIELLSDKHLTALPPSKHRSKDLFYKWESSELMGADLPTLPENFCAIMDMLYPAKAKREYVVPVFHDYNERVEIEQARELLDFISPDCGRDEWVLVGMALQDEYGDFARGLWHSWSAQSPKYKARDAEMAWRSFKGGNTHIGTLIHMAQQQGYYFAPSMQNKDHGFDVDLSYLDKKATLTKPVIKQETIAVSGMVADVAEWIVSTSIRPQPLLALSAALVFMGYVKGHRIRGVTGLRTNIMSLSIGKTSAGKEYPLNCLDRLAEECGLSFGLMGSPASGTGLLFGLEKANSCGLLTIDEMGDYMGNIKHKNSQGYERQIASYMVQLFSSANKTLRAKQFANDKANPPITLKYPHFCCLATTVKEKLQAAMSSSEVIDGFLNRWLVFTSDKRDYKNYNIKFSPPPEELVNKIKAWLEANPLSRDNYGNPMPKEVRFTTEAFDMLVAYDREMTDKLDSVPAPANNLYARCGEHMEKLAMVICDDDVIGINEVSTAIALVNQSTLHCLEFAGLISDNEHEAEMLKVLEVIKDAGNIQKRDLTRKTQHLSQKVRNEIIAQLIDAEHIKVEKTGQQKVSFVYVD